MSDAFRRSLPTLSRLVLAAMLFVQLILLAQACLAPTAELLAAATHEAAMQAMGDDMASATPDCHQQQKATPTTCKAHFDQMHQLPDVPHLPPIAFIAAFILILALPRFLTSLTRPFEALRLKRTTAPPLSIQFCSFQH